MDHEELRMLTMDTFDKIYNRGYEDGRKAGYAIRIDDEESLMRQGFLRSCGTEDNEGEYRMRQIECPYCQRKIAIKIKAADAVTDVMASKKKEGSDV